MDKDIGTDFHGVWIVAWRDGGLRLPPRHIVLLTLAGVPRDLYYLYYEKKTKS